MRFGNFTNIINSKFEIKEYEGDTHLRRVGALGVKLGMTTLWDSWGHVVPATVIQLDRTQIVQIKKPVRNNEYWQVQIGVGEKRLKAVTKPMLGHYLKAGVPPKKKLA
jgi:large subunit ribosomal protein L3